MLEKPTTPRERDDIIEMLIDASNLAAVVDALAAVAGAKAEHIATNWQDAATAKRWDRAARYLNKVAGEIEGLGI